MRKRLIVLDLFPFVFHCVFYYYQRAHSISLCFLLLLKFVSHPYLFLSHFYRILVWFFMWLYSLPIRHICIFIALGFVYFVVMVVFSLLCFLSLFYSDLVFVFVLL